MGRIDLHTHTCYSDGTSTPAELVRKAKARGVEALVVSDHDTVSGFQEAAAEGAKIGQNVFCGVEINTSEEDRVHILGYGIDWRSQALAERLEGFRANRRKRVGLIVERLRALGIEITLEDVRGASRETLGRPHVADALRRKSIVRTRQEAFDRYLAKGAAAYVGPMGPTVQDAIDTIRRAGGWASLAHPGLIRDPASMERWVDCGLRGLEAYYPSHTSSVIRRLLETVKRFDLIATGGSDYHGPGTGREELGNVDFPPQARERVLAEIRPAEEPS